jgi:hypothetical protein
MPTQIDRRTFLTAAAALAALSRLRALARSPRPQRITIDCPTESIADFQALATRAAGLGATHIELSHLPKARWQWYDPTDPWPNWGMLHASFFKIAPPEPLQTWIPREYSLRCQDILHQQGEILRKLNLKATFVYQAHPDWRGPRCQYPPRAHNSYYAPCIDRPEVLAMYRKAVAAICTLVPIEEFTFLTNDSGCGICWHPGLYPGQNGPEYCKSRSMNDRLDGWTQAIKAGAADAGLTAEVSLAGRSTNPDHKASPRTSAGLKDYFYSANTYPIVGLTQPTTFAEQLENSYASPNADRRIAFESTNDSELFDILAAFRQSPAKGPLAREQILANVAAKQAGAEAAPHLLRFWELFSRAIADLAPMEHGGPILLLGTINQRWLVRPLVPFPLELKPEEKVYYRHFQMQAWSEDIAANFMALQGNYIIQGPASAWLATRLFDDATKNLHLAHEALAKAIASAPTEAHDHLQAYDLRLQALILTINNARNVVAYQDFLDHQNQTPNSRPDIQWPRAGHEDGMKIASADMDNTKALIALLESTKIPIFATAPTPAEEDVFLFGPNLVDQLKWKIATTERHLPEHIRFN